MDLQKLIYLVVIASFVTAFLSGYKKGAARSIGSIISLVASLVLVGPVSAMLHGILGNSLTNWYSSNGLGTFLRGAFTTFGGEMIGGIAYEVAAKLPANEMTYATLLVVSYLVINLVVHIAVHVLADAEKTPSIEMVGKCAGGLFGCLSVCVKIWLVMAVVNLLAPYNIEVVSRIGELLSSNHIINIVNKFNVFTLFLHILL